MQVYWGRLKLNYAGQMSPHPPRERDWTPLLLASHLSQSFLISCFTSDRTDSPQVVRKFTISLLSHVFIKSAAEMLLCSPERENYEAILKCAVLSYSVLYYLEQCLFLLWLGKCCSSSNVDRVLQEWVC